MQAPVGDWPSAARTSPPWRLSRSVTDSVAPASAEFARNDADSVRLGLAFSQKVTRSSECVPYVTVDPTAPV